MSTLFLPIGLSVLLCAGQFAYANVEVDFIEGAPKDRFVLTNLCQSGLQDVVVNIDLSESKGQLIFDTTATGAGVEVFQPFEVIKGEVSLHAATHVKDGDKQLSILINQLDVQQSISFSIDVDDTLTISEWGNIRVSGAEITNASVSIKPPNQEPVNARFNDQGKALLTLSSC